MTVYTSLPHLIADKAKSLDIPFIRVQAVYNESIASLWPEAFNDLSGFKLYQVEQQTWVALFGRSDPVPGTVTAPNTSTDLCPNNGRRMEVLRKKLRLQDFMVEKLKEEAEELKEELALDETELGKLEFEVSDIDTELKKQQ